MRVWLRDVTRWEGMKLNDEELAVSVAELSVCVGSELAVYAVERGLDRPLSGG